MSTSDSTRQLISISAEIRRLEQLITDKEWEGQDASVEVHDLNHMRKLRSEGKIYEPLF